MNYTPKAKPLTDEEFLKLLAETLNDEDVKAELQGKKKESAT